MRKTVAVSLSLLAFLFMPLGRYPALINVPMDMLVVNVLLILSDGLLTGLLTSDGKKCRTAFLVRWTARGVILTAMAVLAWWLGLPADLAKFDALIIRPIWLLDYPEQIGWIKFGVAILAVAFGLTLKSKQGTSAPAPVSKSESEPELQRVNVPAKLTQIALAAVFVNVFLPIFPKWRFGQDIAAALDFVLFVVKVAVVMSYAK